MKNFIVFLISLLFLTSCASRKNGNSNNGWISLFDGKTLNGWKSAENPATFKVEDGLLVVHGPRAHLFYNGAVSNHNFKNFEFKARVMTTKGSNSGIFIHTQYQEDGWPSKGYEVQVNQTHTDWRKTGSLYSVNDVKEVYVKDGEWYTEHITVQGNRIIIKINDKTVVDYTEPQDAESIAKMGDKKLSSGTFALQGHDPESKVYFKEVMVKPLAD